MEGHTAAVKLRVGSVWFSAGGPKLFSSLTFLHVRFHLLFLLAYVSFVGVILRMKGLKIYKWAEIIQAVCDPKPPSQLQRES